MTFGIAPERKAWTDDDVQTPVARGTPLLLQRNAIVAQVAPLRHARRPGTVHTMTLSTIV
jgi:hypothetical protein